MIFYLIPFQLLTRIVPNVYDTTIINKVRSSKTIQFNFEYGNSTYISIRDGIMWLPKWLIYVLFIWFVILLIFAIYQVVNYIKSIRYLINCSEEKTCDIPGVGTVTVLINNNITTPYTVGFVHSRIIFPENLIELKHSTLIYKHELCHVKNHDALMKLICLIIVCLHWFNPVAILLMFAYSNLCEYISDDYATKSLNKIGRKQYAQLLLNNSTTKEIPAVWRNNFSTTRYLLQRRLKYIMSMKKIGKIQKIITIAVSVVTVLISSLTVFAYDPMQSSNEIAVSDLEDGDFMGFSFEEDANVLEDVDFDGHDEIFITDSGERIIIEPGSIHAICNHTYKSGTYYKHISDGKGGCTVKLYNAQICTKCNYIKVGALKSTHVYVTCPH